MKTREIIVTASSLSEVKSLVEKTKTSGLLMAVLLMVLLVPLNGMASSQRYVLEFNDSQIRGHKGETATLFLKKSLKHQYPGAEISNMELRRVVLVAKSKMGWGGAQLQVGKRTTPMHQVEGHPKYFHKNKPKTFDRVSFRNPSNDSRGPWQVDLKGHFIVRKVILEVEDHSWSRRHHAGWRRSNW